MSGVPVRLLPHELALAVQAGTARRIDNIAAGRVARPTYGAGQDGAWSCDIEGACGELAVAKHLGLFWSGAIGDLRAADVGHLQVRTTTHPRGRLILHARDDRAAPYVLVRGLAPAFEIVGWCFGHEGIRRRYWEEGTGRPAFFVPDEALRDPASLPRLLAGEIGPAEEAA